MNVNSVFWAEFLRIEWHNTGDQDLPRTHAIFMSLIFKFWSLCFQKSFIVGKMFAGPMSPTQARVLATIQEHTFYEGKNRVDPL